MVARIAIKDICKIYDGPHATPQKTNEGPVYLGIDAITDDGKVDPNQFSHLSEKDYIKWTKRVTPQYGDIVFSYEATLGRYALIPKDFYGCLGRRLAVIRNISSDIDTTWLYYYFRSAEWTNFIQSKIVKGSTVNRISIEDFPHYTIPRVPIETQKKIVDVLARIDRKIQINDAINDNLEQQAKLLYDYWFTQFDFPDKNGNPYRASGGQMEWNDVLNRHIPVGWKAKSLAELMKKNTIAFDYTSTQPAIDLSVMPSGSIALSQLNTSDNFTTNLYQMKKGDILFGSIRPYLHKAGFAPCDGVVAGTVHSYSVKNENDYNFALITVSRNAFFDYAVNVSSGTKMPVVSSDSILAYKVPYNNEIVSRFNDIALMETIASNVQENQKLIELRDWLLPMLMNGQASVED